MSHAASSHRSVTVSIVIHRQWALVRPLLEQLHRYCHECIAKVVLTVNVPEEVELGSGWRFPVEVIFNPARKGFGANHNAAFSHCSTAWFLVLNPDIRLDDDVLATLLAQASPKTGLLTTRIQEPNKPEPEPYRRLLTPLELIRRRRPGHHPPVRPAWVAGMFMLLRREGFAQLHGFDERFFMYCEDFDLCARLRLGGWGIQVNGHTVVRHLAQRASQVDTNHLRWHFVSLLRLWTTSAFWRYRSLLTKESATFKPPPADL